MILASYRFVSTISGPLIERLLRRRLQRGKEDPARSNERRGIPSQDRPEGRLIWLHAASVGEAISALILIERLTAEHPACRLLVTTGTVTSAAILEKRLPPLVLHQYIPVDRQSWVRRFLNHWQPDLALWMESEFWPNLLIEISRRRIPLILLNGRVSPSSYKGWSRFPRTIRRLLGCFSLCMAQSDDDAEKLSQLGANNVIMPGNIKFAAAPLPCDNADLARLQEAIGDRPVWLAACTHDGEEQIVLDAHRQLIDRFPDLLTIIAPRHPARGEHIGEILRDTGENTALRSLGEPVSSETAFYIADTVGEMGLLYRIAPVALVGGSLVPHGGQNLLEAARLHCAIIHGPQMTNFRAIAAELAAENASLEVTDAATLAAAVTTMLTDDTERQRQIEAAAAVAKAKADVLDNVLEALAPWLGEPPGEAHARP